MATIADVTNILLNVMVKHSEATFDRFTLTWIAILYLILLCLALPHLISGNNDKRQSPEEEKKREMKKKRETKREGEKVGEEEKRERGIVRGVVT